MTKKIFDTNIYIDLFINPDLYQDIFVSEGPVCLSSVVVMELLAGAHSRNEKNKIKNLIDLFKRLGRVITPSERDYEQAGEILLRLQRLKGYDLKKCDSISHDCLVAASAKGIGAVVYTQNRKDFQAIQDVFNFKVAFI